MSSAASEPERLEINWFGAAGSALGAVSSAVLLSTLGAAGTLIGAALGSVCITVGGAVYSHSLKKTKERVVDAPALRTRRTAAPGEAPTTRLDVPRPGASTAETHGQGFSRVDVLDDETAPASSWQDTLRELPWKRISIIAGAVFALAITAILMFELLAGKPVSSYTGGTSSSNSGTLFTGGGGGGGTADTDTTTDTEDGTDPQEQPTPEPGQTEQAPEDGDQPAEPTQEQAPGEQAPQDEAPQEPLAPAEPVAPAEPAAPQEQPAPAQP